MPDGIEERELVERAKQDPDAFGALYDRYFPQIYRFAFAKVRDQSLAEDVTSEVFFKALKNINRYTYEGHPFSSWLYQITVNAVADHYRGPVGREVDLEESASMPSSEPSVLDEVVRRERSRQVWSLIDKLPTQQRTAMILKFGEDRKIDDIAVIMGKSPGAVKLLLHRGVERLRKELGAGPSLPGGGSAGPGGGSAGSGGTGDAALPADQENADDQLEVSQL